MAIPVCDKTNNVLVLITSSSEAKYFDPGTKQYYPLTDNQRVLSFNKTSSGNKDEYAMLIKHCTSDPTNKRLIDNCPKCKTRRLITMLLITDIPVVYVCNKCKHNWIPY